ncbi:MAG: hypothetical protein GF353_22135 [Candidatus Lokiarchaeota archaeon]|nr:hypothetical protein [Candidatus Lokiarchaeota archaeon]
MVWILLALPITVLFIINGIVHFYFALKLNRMFAEKHNFINSCFIVGLWMSAGLFYTFVYFNNDQSLFFFQLLSLFFIMIFTPFLLYCILSYQNRLLKKEPKKKDKRIEFYFSKIKEIREEDDLENSNIDLTQKDYDLKTDIYRKFLHLVPAALIIGLWLFAVYVWEGIWEQDLVWGLSGRDFGQFLILTVGYSGVLIFAILDYIRFSYIFKNFNLSHLLPDMVLDLLIKSMKKEEYYDFLKPAALTLALASIFFLPFSIFTAAALISTIGDGAASLFGIKFGKHRFPKNKNKTLIGYISGFFVSFCVTYISVAIFEKNLEIYKLITIALGGALTFFIIDFLNLKIDDDILNPILCALTMAFLLFYI